jgi:hypothetical protein
MPSLRFFQRHLGPLDFKEAGTGDGDYPRVTRSAGPEHKPHAGPNDPMLDLTRPRPNGINWTGSGLVRS